MQHTQAFQAAAALAAARRSRSRLDALAAPCAPADEADAYQIQDLVVTCYGEKVGAWKIGATHPNAQANLGTSGPVAARLFAELIHSGDTVLTESMIIRGLEAEYAFLLGSDLAPRAEPYSRDEVEAAIASVHPAIEVVDTRYGAPQKGAFAIADNVNDGAWIYGEGTTDWRSVDMISAAVTMQVNGEIVASGNGAQVLGDPIVSLMWLANEHARAREGLRAGQFITCGSCTGLYPSPASCTAKASFQGLGEISVQFNTV